jgi:hypothetical protein
MIVFLFIVLFAEFINGFQKALHILVVQPVQIVNIALFVDELIGGV